MKNSDTFYRIRIVLLTWLILPILIQLDPSMNFLDPLCQFLDLYIQYLQTVLILLDCHDYEKTPMIISANRMLLQLVQACIYFFLRLWRFCHKDNQGLNHNNKGKLYYCLHHQIQPWKKILDRYVPSFRH